MLKGTIKSLDLTGNRLTGDYKALDNLATGFVRNDGKSTVLQMAPQRECPPGKYRKTNANAQQNLGTCERTPPVEAELAVQSKETFIEALQKPSTKGNGTSLALVLSVKGGSSFAPQYSATMVLNSSQRMSSRTFTTLNEPKLSLDGLHAEWDSKAPSADADVQLRASDGKFSETRVFKLDMYADCAGAQPCIADGDTIETVLALGNASSPDGQRSQVVVKARIKAVPSCNRSKAVLVSSAGQVDPSTETVHLEAHLVDVDALPITFSNPQVVVSWANQTFLLERSESGSSRFSWEIPPRLRREPGWYAYKVILEEAWDEVERNHTRCTLLEGTLSIAKGFDTKWVLVGSILGAILLIGLALLLVLRHHEHLMAIVVMLVNEIVKLGLSLSLEIGDIVTECAPKHTHGHARTRSMHARLHMVTHTKK
jgi:hypothetical protein